MEKTVGEFVAVAKERERAGTEQQAKRNERRNFVIALIAAVVGIAGLAVAIFKR